MAARTIAVAQIPQTADLGKNLREIHAAAEKACRAGADILCFPECALTGYGPVHHESSANFDWDAVSDAIAEVRHLARECRMALILGTHLPLATGWSNSAFMLGPDGRLLTRYDKAHLYGLDPEYYLAGRERPEVVSVKRMRVGLQICFDIRFPEPFRFLALNGAQVIFLPSLIHGKADMWKRPVIEGHVASRAAENGRYIVFANVAGRDQNVPSLIADPRGQIIARCRKGVRQLLIAKLDPSEVNDNFLSVRRTDLYPSPRRRRR